MSPDDIALVASQQKLIQPTNLNVTVKERATKNCKRSLFETPSFITMTTAEVHELD
jgi:hypothetical protein